MLAMVANDNAGSLAPRGVLGFIASKLAPTVARHTLTHSRSDNLPPHAYRFLFPSPKRTTECPTHRKPIAYAQAAVRNPIASIS
ncbi:hypothetical protein DOZ80_18625 [Pseudomonas fluorescens]|uniref:Uncharacterized protein n=1 Tax=Pseudomonas fluorescens TaxID=294 RepID=A0A327N4B5_PSEFL|nr:hypothetical protein DOZ80_18625 [Pseudomonas fluorescens]